MAREDGERLILYGRHPVLEALRSGGRRVDEVLVDEATGRGADVVALARQAGVRCSPAPRAALTALAGTPHHQGVVARVTAHPYADLEELLGLIARRLRGLLHARFVTVLLPSGPDELRLAAVAGEGGVELVGERLRRSASKSGRALAERRSSCSS